MFNLTDLKNFDLEQLDPTRLDLTRFDLRNIELPKFDTEQLPSFDLPKFELPKFDTGQLPSFDFPKFEMPVEATRLAEFARDTAYASVGAVVTTAKKADEQRRELTDQVTTQVRKLVDAVS
jgi:hypothetical protein